MEENGASGTRNEHASKRQLCLRLKRNICQKCGSYCERFTTASNPLPEKPTICQRMRYAFLCPPHGFLSRWITQFVAVVMVWAVFWAILKNTALPGGPIFALYILIVACVIGGKLISIIRLPPLLGMLIVGFLLRNIPYIDVAKDISKDLSFTLRLVALVVILLRAGLGLDYQKLKSLSWAVVRLSLLPCGLEVVTAAVASHLLFAFPWLWAFLLGFVHAAVSPAVVVPCMLQLQEKGLGVDKGIPTLLIAAGSVENVVAISAFSLVLGLTFSQGSLVYNILRCPMEIVIGILYGLLAGVFCWYFPKVSSSRLEEFRFVLLLSGGLFAMFGSRVVGISGSGALACLVLPFVAREGWRSKGWPNGKDPMRELIGNLWLFFQPLLFGLIGAEVKISDIKAETLGFGAIIMVIALTVRTITTFLSSFGVKLNHKEKLFVALAWIPKATVQAAIGSMALDSAREVNAGAEEIERGTKILTMAVFLIVVTAPVGAILITLTSPKFLSNAKDKADQTQMKIVSDQNELTNPAFVDDSGNILNSDNIQNTVVKHCNNSSNNNTAPPDVEIIQSSEGSTSDSTTFAVREKSLSEISDRTVSTSGINGEIVNVTIM